MNVAGVTFSASGTYTVTVTNAANCTASTTVAVVVNSVPTAGITGTTTACGTVSLTATATPPLGAGGSYAWSNGAAVAGATFSASGTYTVTVTNAGGCTASTMVAVVVNPLPTVNSVSNQTICSGINTAAVTFAGTGATSYTWANDNPAIGLSATGTGNIAVFAATNNTGAPITATVTVTPVSGSPGYAYIANQGANTVSVVNTATNVIVATVAVGTNPLGVSVSPDGSRVYITNFSSDNVSVINTATNVVVATVAVGTRPYGISVSPDGSRVYVSNRTSGSATVSVINTATNIVVATVAVGSSPAGVSVSPDGSRVYVSNNISNTISVINTATNTVVATVAVGSGPVGASVSPDGSRVYVSSYNSNSVSVINTATNTVAATVTVGTNPVGISVSPDGSRVYATNYGANTISVINTATNAVVATVGVGTNPFGVSVSPDGSRVYVTNISSSDVSVINTATNTVAATVAVGLYPNSFGNFVSAATAGCTGTPATFTITVNPQPTASITGTTTDCGAVSLTATGGGTYSWSGGSSTATAANTFSASGTYTVTVTNAAGCTATSTKAVVVNTVPTASASNNSPVAVGGTLNLLSGGGATYAWAGPAFADATQNPAITNFQSANAGIYTVTVTDANGCTATASTTVTTQAAALTFSGTAEFIDLGTSAALKPAAAFTYEAWVNPNAFADAWGGAGFIMADGGDCCSAPAGGMGMHLSNINGAQSPRVYFWKPDNTQAVVVGTSMSTGVWHHIAMAFDGTSLKLYQDGMLTGTTTFAATTVKPITQALLLGGLNNFGYIFHGSMDEVRVWNRALCATEIQGTMNCEIPTTGTGLLANYHFNQGLAGGNNSGLTTLTDASGNGNNGTLFNFTLSGTSSNWTAPGGVITGTTCSFAAALPSTPSLSASSTSNCGTVSTTLSIATGNLNQAANWKWYSGSCGGTLVGTGTSVSVSPTVTTTYFARGEGGCIHARRLCFYHYYG